MDFWEFFRLYAMTKVLLGFVSIAFVLLAFYAFPLLVGAVAGLGGRIMRAVWGSELSRRKDGEA